MNSHLSEIDRPLLDQFCAPMLEIYTDFTRRGRDCPELPDPLFLTLGILRQVLGSDSGRDFLQQAEETFEISVSRATYFLGLGSARREQLVAECSREVFLRNRHRRIDQGHDVFAQIPALRDVVAFAVDGHHLEHATHCETDSQGRYVSENSLYVRCLRTGLLQSMAAVQGQGIYAHEMPVFRRALPEWLAQFPGVSRTKRPILVVDPAFIDLDFWSITKAFAERRCEMITRLKDNMKPRRLGNRAFDPQAEENVGVISDENVVFANGQPMRVVTYRDPETNQIFEFLTTNTTLSPGWIAWLYLQRWGIEKCYDTTKNKLNQRKGWATGTVAQRIQAHFTALSFNLLILLEERLGQEHGIEETKVHQKRKKHVAKREEKAAKQGRRVHPLVHLALRWHQLTSQFIRTLRNLILGHKTFQQALPRFRIMMAKYL